MTRKKTTNANVEEIADKDGVIYFRARRPLTEEEHKQLSEKVRHEMSETGMKIVLVPQSVDVEIK